MTVEARLKQVKPKLLKALKANGADFSFYVVPNRAMEDLRRELIARPDFKGKEAEKIKKEEMVNVLAFSQPKDFPNPKYGEKYLGEVYLNRDFEGGGFEVLGPLFIHGFLHLLGYRHNGKRDTMEMKKEEKRLWHLTLLSGSTSAPHPSKRPSRKNKAAG